VLAFSQFGSGPQAVHSLLDDEFYFGYLVERGVNFVFHAPAHSCARLETLFPAHRQRLRVLRASGEGMLASWRLSGVIEIAPGASVVFFGYSERLVTFFLLRNAWADIRLTLVATNNFSARRVRLYGRRMRAFLRLSRRTLHRLVVHTEHELLLVESLDRTSRARAMSKRHHLMLPREVTRSAGDRPVIAFFGPPKPEKPVEPLAALIAADVGGRFEYRVYGVTETEGRLLSSGASPQARVVIHSGRLSNEAYAQAAAAADIVLLTHNADFEGKLSGNLCDCIAHQVPFLGSKIEPHLEYLRRFGQIGYAVDMTNESWAREFLQSFSGEDLLLRRERMADAAGTFTREAIFEDLDRCIAGSLGSS
jgi:hypothetical protein